MEERRKKKKKKKKGTTLPFAMANRWSKLVEARGKVGLRNKGYAWVPKSEFLVEVLKGGGFSYTGYFFPSGHIRPFWFSSNLRSVFIDGQ